MLSKHKGLCRYPHGHSRTVEIVLCADRLDDQDMVCDFKAIKLALKRYLDELDHALLMNSADPALKTFQTTRIAERLVVLENTDPTTEVLAERIYRFLAQELAAGRTYHELEPGTGIGTSPSASQPDTPQTYRFPPGLRIERVRVSETASTWAEFSA